MVEVERHKITHKSNQRMDPNNHWDLYMQLVKTNFKLRYQGSALGFLWVLMKPFFIFLMLFVVFSSLAGSTKNLTSQEYSVFLLIGIVVFFFTNEGITLGMNSLMSMAKIILKIEFNKFTALASSISLALINFFINAIVLTAVCLYVGVEINIVSGLYLLFILLTVVVFITSVSLFTSIIMIRLRDLTHIVELLMQLMFYGSAVFYPISIVPEKWQFIILLNPIATFIQATRGAVMFGEISRLKYISVMFTFSLILLFFGRVYFKKNVKKVAEFF